MADSIDRVFVKAITTIRALSTRSNHGLLPRPPAESRIKLYGLYKQATEGNVQGIMSRPEGYTIEDEGAKKKWDAWKREEGLPKTQAKRRYILYLIETMRLYASGTLEARELLSELEYLWDQIKDIESVNDEYPFTVSRLPYPQNVTRLVVSNVDQSDRFSTGTPWPLQSNYSALVLLQQHKNNFEQIYLHSRRSNQLGSIDKVQLSRMPGALSNTIAGKTLDKLPIYVDTPNSTHNLEDFRAWQGQINLIINKLSNEFAFRKHLASQLQPSELNEELDPLQKLRKTVLFLLKRVGLGAIRLFKNIIISSFAVLFVVWCANRSVIVKRTIVKRQLQGKSQKELVINMVINTDENKWFIRLLGLINKFVGFV